MGKYGKARNDDETQKGLSFPSVRLSLSLIIIPFISQITFLSSGAGADSVFVPVFAAFQIEFNFTMHKRNRLIRPGDDTEIEQCS
jgi:hypothetical protein